MLWPTLSSTWRRRPGARRERRPGGAQQRGAARSISPPSTGGFGAHGPPRPERAAGDDRRPCGDARRNTRTATSISSTVRPKHPAGLAVGLGTLPAASTGTWRSATARESAAGSRNPGEGDVRRGLQPLGRPAPRGSTGLGRIGFVIGVPLTAGPGDHRRHRPRRRQFGPGLRRDRCRRPQPVRPARLGGHGERAAPRRCPVGAGRARPTRRRSCGASTERLRRLADASFEALCDPSRRPDPGGQRRLHRPLRACPGGGSSGSPVGGPLPGIQPRAGGCALQLAVDYETPYETAALLCGRGSEAGGRAGSAARSPTRTRSRPGRRRSATSGSTARSRSASRASPAPTPSPGCRTGLLFMDRVTHALGWGRTRTRRPPSPSSSSTWITSRSSTRAWATPSATSSWPPSAVGCPMRCGPADTLARLGGDEFAVLVDGSLAGDAAAEGLARRHGRGAGGTLRRWRVATPTSRRAWA